MLELTTFFTFRSTKCTRGHTLKLFKSQCNLDIRKYGFGHRVVNLWNALSEDIIICNSLHSFKSRLDKFWKVDGFLPSLLLCCAMLWRSHDGSLCPRRGIQMLWLIDWLIYWMLCYHNYFGVIKSFTSCTGFTGASEGREWLASPVRPRVLHAAPTHQSLCNDLLFTSRPIVNYPLCYYLSLLLLPGLGMIERSKQISCIFLHFFE